VSIACGCLNAGRAVHAGSWAGGLAAVGLHRIHASDAPGSAFASSAPVRRDHACRCIRRAGGRAGLCRPGGGWVVAADAGLRRWPGQSRVTESEVGV